MKESERERGEGGGKDKKVVKDKERKQMKGNGKRRKIKISEAAQTSVVKFFWTPNTLG